MGGNAEFKVVVLKVYLEGAFGVGSLLRGVVSVRCRAFCRPIYIIIPIEGH